MTDCSHESERTLVSFLPFNWTSLIFIIADIPLLWLRLRQKIFDICWVNYSSWNNPDIPSLLVCGLNQRKYSRGLTSAPPEPATHHEGGNKCTLHHLDQDWDTSSQHYFLTIWNGNPAETFTTYLVLRQTVIFCPSKIHPFIFFNSLKFLWLEFQSCLIIHSCRL